MYIHTLHVYHLRISFVHKHSFVTYLGIYVDTIVIKYLHDCHLLSDDYIANSAITIISLTI